jgi:tetratricopeptide (TPR) repeat protein
VTQPTAQAQVARAETLFNLGRFAEARQRVADVLAADPSNAAAMRLLARCHTALREYREAVRVAHAAVAAEPTSSHGHRVLAHALNSAGDRWAATNAAHEAVRLAPHSWHAHLMLAECLRHGDPYAALSCAARARELAPLEPAIHITYGVIQHRLGRTDEARAAYLKALELDPEHASAHNNLAVLDRKDRRWLRALSGFRTSLRNNPQDPLARANMVSTIVLLLGYLCTAALGTAVIVTILSVVLSGATLRIVSGGVIVALLATVAALVGRARRRIGPAAFRSVRADHRVSWALGVFGVLMLYVALGGVAQVFSLRAVAETVAASHSTLGFAPAVIAISLAIGVSRGRRR